MNWFRRLLDWISGKDLSREVKRLEEEPVKASIIENNPYRVMPPEWTKEIRKRQIPLQVSEWPLPRQWKPPCGSFSPSPCETCGSDCGQCAASGNPCTRCGRNWQDHPKEAFQ